MVDEGTGHLSDKEGRCSKNADTGTDEQFFDHEADKGHPKSDLNGHAEEILGQKPS